VKILACLLVLFNLSTDASTPTVEGLFRNGHNAELSGEWVVLRGLLKLKSEENVPISQDDLLVANPLIGSNEVYVKIIYEVRNESVKILQALYSQGDMRDSSMINVRLKKQINDLVISDNIERALFISLLSSLALNRSNEMATFLKLYEPKFQSNIELVSQEKKKLYSKYKEYLLIVNEDKTLKETMINPLKPEAEEEKTKVGEVMKLPFYETTEYVKLKREGKRFIWEVGLDNTLAVFDNQSHRFQKMEFRHRDNQYKISASDYVLFNGVHEMPKFLNISINGDKKYVFRTLTVRHLMAQNRTLVKWHQKYLKKLASSTSKKDALKLPPILIQ
jgi:Txe/YoeB family toxin of Txe-Axe toxin-antitoxin module